MTVVDLSGQLPEAFLSRLQSIVPASQWEAVVEGLLHPAPTSFRVNTLKVTVDALLAELRQQNIEPTPVPWQPLSFTVKDSERDTLTHSAAFNGGRIYIQNLSSIFTAQTLDAQADEEILDLAAAPGGKTLALAVAMQNRGRIAAVEPVKSRFFRLKNNIALHGADIVECYLKDGRQVGRQVPERFDRVLLDAPCSAESRFVPGEPETYQYWSEKKIQEMQRKQKQLLHSALLALKPGGVMVYSTCSFAPEENELVVDRQLRKLGDKVTVLPVTVPFPNVQAGLTAWKKKTLDPRLSQSVRILPSALMEGFFLCMLQKLR